MVIIDRVVCDFCHTLVGQIYNTPADIPLRLVESVPPHFVVCPDCYPAPKLLPQRLFAAGVNKCLPSQF